MGPALLLLFLVYALICLYRDLKYLAKGRKLEKQKQAENDAIQEDLAETKLKLQDLYAEISILEANLRDLSPYTAIKDIDDELKSISAKIREKQQEAETIINQANLKATSIINDAKSEAEKIAGAAIEAMNNAEHYKKAATAMKNIIDGYGDEYLKPTHSLLDDLSEEMGHTQAAQKLKEARQASAAMVKSNNAADCDYVETDRRTTAIRFVIDAFNGKADAILSRVKHDNYGKLEQEIKDAFSMVNQHGKAFRSARINESYLAARLNELNWAVITMELKEQEKEEQRRIKEQIREEERARREYAKAMQEAEKEEAAIKKAMEKVTAEISKATEEQRQKFELQLAELQTKLQAAEEKNQRAISMAQQTKTGHVYIISNIGSFGENVYKIGLTRRLEPLDRIKELGDASVPFDFDIHAMIMSEDAPALERALHKHFIQAQVNKVNPRKEFFRIDLPALKGEVEKLGIEAKWTMTAEATQYRETLAIERQMRENPQAMAAWMKDQLEADPIPDIMEPIED